jgi:prepilin-type N-terminal cleavage/methylation domain-containing protein
MKNLKKINSNHGVTLVEIVVAIIIFAVVAIPIYKFVSYGAATEIETEKTAIANKILESFKDEIIGMPFETLEGDFPNNTEQDIGADYPNVFNSLFEAQKKYKDFEFTGKVKTVSSAAVPTMEFSGEVTWTSAYNKVKKSEKIFFIKVKR